jgi:hypothetical protein
MWVAGSMIVAILALGARAAVGIRSAFGVCAAPDWAVCRWGGERSLSLGGAGRPQSGICGRIGSDERRGEGGEFGAVAKALKVDPIDLFTRFVRVS